MLLGLRLVARQESVDPQADGFDRRRLLKKPLAKRMTQLGLPELLIGFGQ